MTFIPSIENIVDTNNSTSTPLTAGATYTGTIIDVSKYTSIFINLFADQNSSINGFTISFSTDGVNFDTQSHNILSYNTTNPFFTHSIQVTAKYYRLSFTNGGVSQTVFRLQSLLTLTSPSSFISGETDITTKTSSSLSTSILSGLLPNATNFKNVKATSDGALEVSINNPLNLKFLNSGNIVFFEVSNMYR